MSIYIPIYNYIYIRYLIPVVCCLQVLILMLLGDELSPSTHVSLLKLLMPLAQELHKIELLLPEQFYSVRTAIYYYRGFVILAPQLCHTE